jgi:hypothetical protein
VSSSIASAAAHASASSPACSQARAARSQSCAAEPVTASVTDEGLWPERASEPADQRRDARAGLHCRAAQPDHLDHPVDRHDAAPLDREQIQQFAALAASSSARSTSTPPAAHCEGADQPHRQDDLSVAPKSGCSETVASATTMRPVNVWWTPM